MRGETAGVFDVFGGLDVGVVAVQIDPLPRALSDLWTGAVGIAVFDDVNVLDPEAFRGAQGGVGIVRLKDILEDDGDVSSSVSEDVFDEGLFVLGDKGFEKVEIFLNTFFVHKWCESLVL